MRECAWQKVLGAYRPILGYNSGTWSYRTASNVQRCAYVTVVALSQPQLRGDILESRFMTINGRCSDLRRVMEEAAVTAWFVCYIGKEDRTGVGIPLRIIGPQQQTCRRIL